MRPSKAVEKERVQTCRDQAGKQMSNLVKFLAVGVGRRL